MSLVAYVGSALLPVAWLFETYATYEAGNIEAVDIRFVALYVIGSALLAYHAFMIQDLPFIILNVTMTMFTGTELVLLVAVKRGESSWNST